MKKLTIILTILGVSMMFAHGSYSAMNDKSDRLSGSQSSVFSPGYINSTMQKTREIINQAESRKSPIEVRSDAVKDDISNKVAEDNADKPKLDLKKKVGGTGDQSQRSSAASSDIIIDMPSQNESGDISADVRNTIQTFLDDQEGSIGSHRIVSAAGRYMVTWQELGADKNYSLKAQMFDSDGKALLSDPYSLTGHSMYNVYINNVTALSNGNFAVFWQEMEYIAGVGHEYSVRAQMFDSGGKALLSNPYSMADRITFAKVDNVTTFSNGNFAVFWQEQGVDRSYSLKAQMFDSGGKALLSNPYNMTNDKPLSFLNNVTTLSNGNLAVFWDELGIDNKHSLKAQMFDSGGKALLSDPYSVANNSSYMYSLSNVTALSNGNLAVFWQETGSEIHWSFKAQMFDSEWKALLPEPYSLTSSTANAHIYSVNVRSNGNLAVFWQEIGADGKYSLKAQMFDGSGEALLSKPYTFSSNMTTSLIGNVTMLSNGNFAVFWQEQGADYKYSLKAQIFDSGGKALLSNPYSIISNANFVASVSSVITLSDGNLAALWQERGADGKYSLKAQIFDSGGKALLSNPYSITNNANYAYVNDVIMLSNGNLAVFWNELGTNKYSFKSQVIDSSGKGMAFDNFAKSISDAAISKLGQGTASSQFLSSYNAPYITQDLAKMYFDFGKGRALVLEKGLGDIFKGLLANKGALEPGNYGQINPNLIARIVQDSLGATALALPDGQVNPGELDLAMRLANILQNPTDEQKLIIDSMKALLADTENQIDRSASPEALKKAQDDLLQMVAAVLIAQAIPDLFKETDALNIKSIFQELNSSKGRIVLEYQESTKPYYNEIVKEMSKNMALLQLQNILNNSMTKEELERLPRNEIDKILQKLKDTANKTEEINLVLKKEEDARIRYLDPNKRLLEDKMKKMMQDFTGRLSKVLESKTK
jgi:type IV secretory pathway TrbF-like protein